MEEEKGLPIWIALVVSAVIVGVFVFIGALLNAILQIGQ